MTADDRYADRYTANGLESQRVLQQYTPAEIRFAASILIAQHIHDNHPTYRNRKIKQNKQLAAQLTKQWMDDARGLLQNALAEEAYEQPGSPPWIV